MTKVLMHMSVENSETWPIKPKPKDSSRKSVV